MNDRAQRILKLIEESNISYSDLAKRTGISKSALQRYAKGTTEKIPIDRIAQIAKAFDVSSAYLMGWQERKENDPAPQEETNLVLKEINILARSLPYKLQEVALEQIRCLSKLDILS